MRLIIFDCDGTLVDSQHMIVSAMRSAFAAAGYPAPDRSLVLQQVGLSITEAMEVITGSRDTETVALLGREYRSAFAALRDEDGSGDPLYPGAQATLQRLAACDDVLLGLATGKSRRGVDAVLEREGWRELFATIQTADDAPSKPHPAMIEQAMEETGAAVADTVMIGDTSHDMLMAKAASVEAIGVGWGYHAPEELMEAGAMTVLKDFAELADLLFAKEKV